MRALFFGTYDALAHPRVDILLHGLREHGVDVVECNVPLGISTARRVSMLTHPWRLPALALRLLRCWASLVRRARRIPPADVVVVGYLGHFDVQLARRLFRRTPIVLDHLIGASDTAADRGVSGGLRQRLLSRLDRAALSAADLVLVDTEEHLATLALPDRAKAAVVAVGAPPAWLAAGEGAQGLARDTRLEEARRDPTAATAGSAPEAKNDQPLRVVFFGLYTPLQGAPSIGRALALLTEEAVEVLMLGSGQDLAETRRLASGNSQVSWQEWVSPAALPTVVAERDVCLGIFGTSPKALRVVPNKVFQGAAAGCALVTSDTPPQRRLLRDAALFVAPGNPEALADALRELARDRVRLARFRAAARALALESFTPARVTSDLVDRLEPLANTAGRSRR